MSIRRQPLERPHWSGISASPRIGLRRQVTQDQTLEQIHEQLATDLQGDPHSLLRRVNGVLQALQRAASFPSKDSKDL